MKAETIVPVLALIAVVGIATLLFTTNDNAARTLGLAQFTTAGDADVTSDEVADVTGASAQRTATADGTTPAATAEGELRITYTDDGFEPSEFQIYAGTTVRFVNSDNETLRVVGTQYKNGEVYPGFDAVKSVGAGESYVFTFTEPGVWSFKNLNKGTHVGTVIVIPQP